MLNAAERLGRPYMEGLRRFWWLAPLSAVLAGAVALVLAERQPATFAANATAAVAPSAEVQETADMLRSLETLERRTVLATFARMASTHETRARAAALAGLDVREVARYSVNASVISSTNLLRVRVEGPGAEQVAALADASLVVVEEGAERLYRLFTLEPVEAASVPRIPIHPDPARSVGVATVIGLFLGALSAALAGALPGPGRGLSLTPGVTAEPLRGLGVHR